MKKLAVCFVCLGNICRSPMAEGVMLELVRRAGLSERITVDSAGTGAWHVGEPPDPRAVAAAAQRRYDLRSLRARQVADTDFARFDLILAMDQQNLTDLQRRCPSGERHKLSLLMRFATQHQVAVVADPYSGGAAGFERTLDYCEDACAGVLDTLKQRLESA